MDGHALADTARRWFAVGALVLVLVLSEIFLELDERDDDDEGAH